MNIDKNIFELRKSKRLTQSELAQKLGVTEQTISKWENGICSPDISMLPQLARLFNVSIDRVFGYHLNTYEEEVNKILSQKEELLCDTNDESYLLNYINYLTEALERFPNSDKLKYELAFSYFMNYRIGKTEKDIKDSAKRAVDLCNEIIGSSFDDQLLDSTNILLVKIYSETHEYDKALTAADKISANSYSLKIIAKSTIYYNRKDNEALQKHVEQALYDCFVAMDISNQMYCSSLENSDKTDEAIKQCKLQDKLLSLFDEGGKGFYASHKSWNAWMLARLYKRLNNKEECLNELLRYTISIQEEAKYSDLNHSISARNSFFKTADGGEEFAPKGVEKAGLQILRTFQPFLSEYKEYSNLLEVLSRTN